MAELDSVLMPLIYHNSQSNPEATVRPIDMEDCQHSHSLSVRTLFLCMNVTSGLLSIIGSSVVIFIILRGGQRKLSRMYNRLILGISAIDVLFSIALGFAFIPSPQLDNCSFGKGNDLSCTTQGFFLILGLAVPGYVAMLSTYYLVTIAYNNTEEMITQKFEPFMHAYAVLPPLICASIGASNSYFFSQTEQCWIEDPCVSSQECDGWDGYGKGGWLVIASIIWVGSNSLATLLCMFIIYRKINERAIAMRRYIYSNENTRTTRMDVAANESAKQGLLYTSAFMFTYTVSGVMIWSKSRERDRPQTSLYILTAVFLPLQGFWNFLAYIRPRFVSCRQENESLSFLSTLKMIILTEEESASSPRTRQQRRRSIPFDTIESDIIPQITDPIKSNIDDDAPLGV